MCYRNLSAERARFGGGCDHGPVAERVSSDDLARIERLSRLLGMQTLLAHVAREIGPALELRPVLHSILGAMRSLMDFRGGAILLVENGEVYAAATDPAVTADVAAIRVPVGSGLAGRAVAEGRVVYSPDLDRDHRIDPKIRRTGSNAAMKSFLAVPLVCL